MQTNITKIEADLQTLKEEIKQTRLRRYLDSRGMDMLALAYKSGVNYNTVRHIVMGYNDNPTLKTINKILKALKCKFEKVF